MRVPWYFLLPWLAWLGLTACAPNGESNGEVEPGSVIIGIDLGTTHTCVGVHTGGRVEIIANDEGDRLTPSWVHFGDDGIRVGNAAKRSAHTAPEQSVFAVKRFIGRAYDDPNVTQDMRHVPFAVVNEDGKPFVRVSDGNSTKTYSPEQISAIVLAKIKTTAEAYVGKKVTHAIITVPAYFNDAQRKATMEAGNLAGLHVIRTLNEPTAAAIAYGLDKKDHKSRIIVYDLGGGTLDVTLLSIENNVFEVLATSGNTHLGGEDFNNRVVDRLVRDYQQKTGYDAMSNPRALLKLRNAVENAKRILSMQATTKIEIEAFENGNDYSEVLTRSKFDNLNFDLFLRSLEPIRKVLKDAGVEKQDVDEIVLVGGSTRIPKIQYLLAEFFDGKEPSKGVNADEAVAVGAALQAAVFAGELGVQDVVVLELCPLSIGIEVAGGKFEPIIPRQTRVPTKRSQIYSTYSDSQPTIQIKIFEGEHPETKKNYPIGTFELSGIPLAARGVPEIEITFSLDTNGMLRIDAQDIGTGQAGSITIAKEARATAEDVTRMIHKVDADEREKAEAVKTHKALNNLRQVIANLERQVNDAKTMSDLEKFTVRSVVKYMSQWVNKHGGRATVEELEAKHDEALGTSERYFGALGNDLSAAAAHNKHNEL
ncbi:ATPase with role in protein import into the ER [Ceratobasidium sp. 428]|nr:ATPase with role in protein import into the ER [Ceratobasidium sp. 428]